MCRSAFFAVVALAFHLRVLSALDDCVFAETQWIVPDAFLPSPDAVGAHDMGTKCDSVYASVPLGYAKAIDIRWQDAEQEGDPYGGGGSNKCDQNEDPPRCKGYWGHAEVGTPAECAEKCDADSNCKGFNFWTTTSAIPNWWHGHCQLGGRTYPNRDYVSYTYAGVEAWYCPLAKATPPSNNLS